MVKIRVYRHSHRGSPRLSAIQGLKRGRELSHVPNQVKISCEAWNLASHETIPRHVK